MNSQLRKKSDSRNVEDLKSDMKDGVAFAYLIEIVGKSLRGGRNRGIGGGG